MRFSKSNKLLVSIGLFLLICFYFFSYSVNEVFKKKLNWDEIDYVKASNENLTSIIFDTNTISFKNFLKLSVLKYYKKNDEINKLSATLIDEEKDSFYLRHMHGVIPYIYWHFFYADDPEKNTIKLRYSNLILLSLTFLSIFYILKDEKISFGKYFLITGFTFSILTSEFFMRYYTDLNHHNFYALICILFLYRFTKLIKKVKIKNIIFFSLFTAMLMLTLETFLFSIFAIVLFFLYQKLWEIFRFFDILKFFLITFLFIILINPGFIISLSPIKGWFMYAYRIFLNSNTEHKNVDVFLTFYNLFKTNYTLVFLFFANIILIFQYRKKLNNIIILNLTHFTIYLILISPFLMADRYIIPIILNLLICFNFLIIKTNYINKFNKTFYFTFLIIFFITIFTNFYNFQSNYFETKKYNKNINQVLELINKDKYKNTKILIDGSHIFKFYNNNINLHNLSYPSNEVKPEFLTRENRVYVNLNQKIKSNYFNLIIIENRRAYQKEEINLLLNNNYILLKLNTYDVYKLKKSN